MERVETQTINLREVLNQTYPKVNNNWSMKRKVKHRKFIAAKIKRHQLTIVSVLRKTVSEQVNPVRP
jgi:hypothetical protein